MSATASPWAALRKAANFACLRALISPGGQAWQWLHSRPLEQPCGFQNQAHGRHSPVPCRNEPLEGRRGSAGVSGSGISESSDGTVVGTAVESSSPTSAAHGPVRQSAGSGTKVTDTGERSFGNCSVVGPVLSPAGAARTLSLLPAWRRASAFNSATFSLLRRWISPLGHRWQCLHSRPFRQPCAFQNQAHGLHSPVLWNSAPFEGRPQPGASAVRPGGAKPGGGVPGSSAEDRQGAPSSLGLADP
mmetsp:Transcript_72199/g.199131  ORF Transcript_72199/g.199131 Transcript_72199/m.199131 type:complete len:246 (+) Transcript_72199:239-976(+)